MVVVRSLMIEMSIDGGIHPLICGRNPRALCGVKLLTFTDEGVEPATVAEAGENRNSVTIMKRTAIEIS